MRTLAKLAATLIVAIGSSLFVFPRLFPNTAPLGPMSTRYEGATSGKQGSTAARAVAEDARAGVTPPESQAVDIISALGSVCRRIGIDTGLALSDPVVKDWNRKFAKARGEELVCALEIADLQELQRTPDGRVELCVLLKYQVQFPQSGDSVRLVLSLPPESGCYNSFFDVLPCIGVRQVLSEKESLALAARRGEWVRCSGRIERMRIARHPMFDPWMLDLSERFDEDYEWTLLVRGLTLGETVPGPVQETRAPIEHTPPNDGMIDAIPEPKSASQCPACGGTGWATGQCGICNGPRHR